MNVELIGQLLKAYTNGDSTLDSFGDSPEKTSILETIASWKSQIKILFLIYNKKQIKIEYETFKNI